MSKKTILLFALAAVIAITYLPVSFANHGNGQCEGGTDKPHKFDASGNWVEDLPCPGTFENPVGADDFASLFFRVAGQVYIIAAPVLALMMLFGGFQILLSEGNPEKFNKGKNTIIYGAIGFVIILISSGLGYIVRNVLSDGGGGAYAQSAYAAYSQSAYYTQSSYVYGQSAYTYTQSSYAYAQSSYYSQSNYAYSQSAYVYSQSSYAYAQSTYAYSQSSYAYAQSSYAYSQSGYYGEACYVGVC